jgi:hypothetical protein
MLGNLFFKQPAPIRTHQYTHQDAMRDMEAKLRRESQRIYKGGRPFDNNHNNDSVRPFVSHPRFGFQTLLNQHSPAPLPTAPPVVGGNVDWTRQKVTPASQYLHSVLSVGRPMNPPPALGSVLRLGEPNVNSIHTTY